jgi:putative ABC transport system permease protein
MISNTFFMALRAIRQNVMRSALTVLGIVIGVGSVVLLVTIGQGASMQVADEIGAMGENLLTLRPGAAHRPGEPSAAAPSLTVQDAEAVVREVNGVDFVAPSAASNMVVVYGNANWSTTVTGTTDSYFSCHGYRIDKGRDFVGGEEIGMKPVCVLGATVKEKLFGTEESLGKRIRIGKMPCSVIGTLQPKGQNSMGMDRDDIILVPVRVFQRRIAGNDTISRISITVSKNRSTAAVKADVESLMRERRGLISGATDNFEVRDLKEIASAMQQTTSVMTTLLSAIAAVSLLVGGIGIMNIMLVSVTERTREIGIRLAIGATRAEVRLQFLVEAAVLSGFGGLFGIGLGTGGAYLATKALDMPFIPSPMITAVALIFSVAVGILFGSLPAHRASRLDPMEALRHE